MSKIRYAYPVKNDDGNREWGLGYRYATAWTREQAMARAGRMRRAMAARRKAADQ